VLPELLPLLLPPTSLQIPGVRLEHPQVPAEVQHLLNTQGPGQDDTLHAPEEPPDELLPASAPLVVPPLLELAVLPLDPPLLPLDPLPPWEPLLLLPEELEPPSTGGVEPSSAAMPLEDPLEPPPTKEAPLSIDASLPVAVPLCTTLPLQAVTVSRAKNGTPALVSHSMMAQG
jgi:hypothetical protein